MASNGVPYRQADSEALRLLLRESGASAHDYPNRDNVVKAIDVVYRTVVKKIRADMHRASAFSLVFDGWTARGLRNAYIAILYSWIDENFKAKKLRLFCRSM